MGDLTLINKPVYDNVRSEQVTVSNVIQNVGANLSETKVILLNTELVELHYIFAVAMLVLSVAVCIGLVVILMFKLLSRVRNKLLGGKPIFPVATTWVGRTAYVTISLAVFCIACSMF